MAAAAVVIVDHADEDRIPDVVEKKSEGPYWLCGA